MESFLGQFCELKVLQIVGVRGAFEFTLTRTVITLIGKTRYEI